MTEPFFERNKFYRFIDDPPCPGPRRIHIFGEFSKREDFQRFLETNDVDAVVVDDTSLFKPMQHQHREELKFGGWLPLLRTCGSGEYNLSMIQRYLFEMLIISQEFGNLMRDRPLFLGEHVFEAFEQGNEKTWSEKFCKHALSNMPTLERVFTSKFIFAAQVKAQLKASEGRRKPNPKSNEIKEYMLNITEPDSDFEFCEDMFTLLEDNRSYLYAEVGPTSRDMFTAGWGKAYVHNLYKKASSGHYDTVAIVTTQDQFMDEIVKLWGKTSDYDVKELEQQEKRLSPRYKLGYGLFAFVVSHFLMRTRGTPGMQKAAALGGMLVITGGVIGGSFFRKLLRHDRVIVKRSQEYRDYMSARGASAAIQN